jgi:very-short-patch-repair endonuclease
VTSVPRTVLDVAGIVDPYLLERIVDGFLDRRLATASELIACVDRLGGHGRAGSGELVRILNERIGMDKADSTLERRILRAIRRHGLPEPVPQFQVIVDGRLFIIDYAFPEARVGVEGDGFGAHGSHGAFHRDKERDNMLGNAGWLMRHFTARSSDHYIGSTVAAALALRNCGQSNPLLPGPVHTERLG